MPNRILHDAAEMEKAEAIRRKDVTELSAMFAFPRTVAEVLRIMEESHRRGHAAGVRQTVEVLDGVVMGVEI
jgi:hypothetical protein